MTLFSICCQRSIILIHESFLRYSLSYCYSCSSSIKDMSTYQKLPLGSNDGEAYLVHSTNPDTSICSTCSQYSRQRNLLPWIWCSLCTIVTVLAVVRSTLQQTPFLTSPPSSGNRAPKHATDFISAPKTPYVTREFYNYYDFNPADHRIEFNRTLASKPGFTLYAGVPTKEIDEAWEELLGGTWMAIDGEEVSSVQAAAPWPLDPFGEEGQVYMEVGVFHDLHCVVSRHFHLNFTPSWQSFI